MVVVMVVVVVVVVGKTFVRVAVVRVRSAIVRCMMCGEVGSHGEGGGDCGGVGGVGFGGGDGGCGEHTAHCTLYTAHCIHYTLFRKGGWTSREGPSMYHPRIKCTKCIK